MPAFQFVAILAATFFSGAAIYINLAEHPARMECGTQLAATVFGPSYRRAAVMQIIFALAAAIGGITPWFLGAPRLWFVGAVLIFAVIPFTLIVIMPTNKKLLDPALDRTSEVTVVLANPDLIDKLRVAVYPSIPFSTPRMAKKMRSNPSSSSE